MNEVKEFQAVLQIIISSKALWADAKSPTGTVPHYSRVMNL